MIQSNKGYTLLQGRVIDFLQEFPDIVADLLENSPEVVCATFSAYSLELKQEVTKCNPLILKEAEKIVREVKESRKHEKH